MMKPQSGFDYETFDFEGLAASLVVLSEVKRLLILGVLVGEPEGRTVEEIRQLVGLTQPNASHHLRILEEGGLIKRHREGICRYAVLLPDVLAERVQSLVDMDRGSAALRPRGSRALQRA